MTALDDLRAEIEHRRLTVGRADADLDEAVLRAYRAKREDGTPAFTLAEIGETLGVSRQRAHQLVREIAARQAR
jgi:DNA-directed RNA polymerase sigma subunit (sigma70/sigma32)